MPTSACRPALPRWRRRWTWRSSAAASSRRRQSGPPIPRRTSWRSPKSRKSDGCCWDRSERPLDRVFAVVDRGIHGRAALDLALRVAIRKKSGLHAVLVPEDGTAEDAELLDLIRDAGRALGRRLHTDVLSAPTAAQLARQTPGGLVVIATNLADKLGLSAEDLTDPKRCVVVGQGSDSAPVQFGPPAAERHRPAKP